MSILAFPGVGARDQHRPIFKSRFSSVSINDVPLTSSQYSSWHSLVFASGDRGLLVMAVTVTPSRERDRAIASAVRCCRPTTTAMGSSVLDRRKSPIQFLLSGLSYEFLVVLCQVAPTNDFRATTNNFSKSS